MEKCHVLFPGKFKPVHSGHLSLMLKYLNSTEYDVDLTIIISKTPKEGLIPETSKWFLDKVFAKYRNVHVIVSPTPSPIMTVYNITGQKELGDGIYAMGTSAKGDDIKRAEEYVLKFSEGQKYYTPGVKTVFFPINPEPMMYSNRKDMYAGAPISSTIVRMDVRAGDYEMFRTSYIPMIEEGLVNERILKEYFEKISAELLPAENKVIMDSVNESLQMLNEGGAAGHMEHPYDVDEFTFSDLKKLIVDLFAGEIHDITEKLDGQNLFASVDNYGNTIFARNASHIMGTPWLLNDIMNNPAWVGVPSVQHAFSNGALTIDKVFKNIPNAVKFFNAEDTKTKQRMRKWVNLEILDTQNFNVIPYVESKISFHGFKLATFNYGDIDAFNNEKDTWTVDASPSNEQDLATLNKAIQKTNRTAFKAQVTPEVIIKNVDKGELKAQKYLAEIDKILSAFDLPDEATIANYKVEGICQHIESSSKLDFISGDLLDMLIKKWVFGYKDENITKIVKNYTNADGMLIDKAQYAILSDFAKNDLPLLLKKILKPLDNLFMKVGNEVIKSVTGLANAGHEPEVVKRLRNDMKTIQDAVNNADDEDKKRKLEASLARLSIVNNELNATEGIVFNYQGHTLKLTGSFAPLNQLIGIGKYSR